MPGITERMTRIFLILVIGWMLGYAHHFLAMKKHPEKVRVLVVNERTSYESVVEARKAYRALRDLGVRVQWDEEIASR